MGDLSQCSKDEIVGKENEEIPEMSYYLLDWLNGITDTTTAIPSMVGRDITEEEFGDILRKDRGAAAETLIQMCKYTNGTAMLKDGRMVQVSNRK